MSNAQVLFISHGGGPLPLLNDPEHEEMKQVLRTIAQNLRKPRAILLVSAHWEEDNPTLTSSAHPEIIYDYYGFPKEAYDIKYPCKGIPELAESLRKHMENNGVNAICDEKRGFDHGMYVPLKIMYPEADIPCVQLSLVSSLDPKVHIEIGKSLKNFSYDELLIIGSGFSFHNMKAFFEKNSQTSTKKNLAFEQWIKTIVQTHDISENEREEALTKWYEAPHAEFCHPRSEHLLPLHFCYGVAGKACDQFFSLKILNKHTSMVFWEVVNSPK